VEAAAPDDISESAQTLVEQGRLAVEDPAGEGPSDEFYAAYGEVAAWMTDNCDYGTLDVVGEDYAFEGIPETVPAGPTVVTFENTGTEMHEIALVRINDDVDASIDELL